MHSLHQYLPLVSGSAMTALTDLLRSWRHFLFSRNQPRRHSQRCSWQSLRGCQTSTCPADSTCQSVALSFGIDTEIPFNRRRHLIRDDLNEPSCSGQLIDRESSAALLAEMLLAEPAWIPNFNLPRRFDMAADCFEFRYRYRNATVSTDVGRSFALKSMSPAGRRNRLSKHRVRVAQFTMSRATADRRISH